MQQEDEVRVNSLSS